MSTIAERLQVEISPDQTKAFLSFIPGSEQEGMAIPLKIEEVLSFVKETHKIQNFNQELLKATIDDYNSDFEDFGKLEIASTAKPMVPGENGRIEWCIESEDPSEDAQGRINFYSFSTLKNVSAGQLIARLVPAKQGEVGLSVQGEELPFPAVEEVVFVAGDNVSYDEETYEFYAEQNGRVEVRGQVILISRVFEVEGDLDFSIGNVNFDGLVRVHGAVNDNFNIRATEGVQVDGIVQAATIHSGGTVVVMGGVNCRGRGRIDSAGDLLTRFLNNSTVLSQSSVKVENEIINCTVHAEEIHVPTGQVAGGELVGKKVIEVKEAGSQMGVRTVLQVGYDYLLEKEVEELGRKFDALVARVKELDQKIRAAKEVFMKVSEEKQLFIMQMEERIDSMRRQMEELQEDLELKRRQIHSTDAEIIIHQVAYPGVVIRIGRYEKSLTKEFEGYRRYRFNPHKYDIVAHFDNDKEG